VIVQQFVFVVRARLLGLSSKN